MFSPSASSGDVTPSDGKNTKDKEERKNDAGVELSKDLVISPLNFDSLGTKSGTKTE